MRPSRTQRKRYTDAILMPGAMLQFAGLRKEYDALVAVENLTLEIPEGEIFGLLGPNGAGKTTTIRMACGLIRPTEGSVIVNGVNVHQEPERAHRGIGYLSDFFSLYEDLKVWEYLDYYARAYKMPNAEVPVRIDEAIRDAGVEAKRDEYIRGLSRGMKQRLGIARAVIHRPKVLLLDEPASGLDPKARMDLRNLLLGLRDQGATILISSHILTELEGFCTSIGIMERGRLVSAGKIGQIVADSQTFRAVRLAWIGGRDALVPLLGTDARVKQMTLQENEGVFQFTGDEPQLAALLASLIAAGAQIVAFGEVKQTVEDLYFKLSNNQVS
jgi:ABC-2 type transport system ATP-binding protein